MGRVERAQLLAQPEVCSIGEGWPHCFPVQGAWTCRGALFWKVLRCAVGKLWCAVRGRSMRSQGCVRLAPASCISHLASGFFFFLKPASGAVSALTDGAHALGVHTLQDRNKLCNFDIWLHSFSRQSELAGTGPRAAAIPSADTAASGLGPPRETATRQPAVWLWRRSSTDAAGSPTGRTLKPMRTHSASCSPPSGSAAAYPTCF